MNIYCRLHKKGALVFRVETTSRRQEVEFVRIAEISPDGEVAPHKHHPATVEEMAEAAAWWRDWSARREESRLEKTEQVIARLNGYAGWLTRKATDDEVARLSEPLLMAMLDLREEVLRRVSKMETGQAAIVDPGAGESGGGE